MTTRDSHIGHTANTVCPIKSQLIHPEVGGGGLFRVASRPSLDAARKASMRRIPGLSRPHPGVGKFNPELPFAFRVTSTKDAA